MSGTSGFQIHSVGADEPMLSARKCLRYAACPAGPPSAARVFAVIVLLSPVPFVSQDVRIQARRDDGLKYPFDLGIRSNSQRKCGT